jgi:hypothetical protein
MPEAREPLLSNGSIGAIADLARSEQDVEGALAQASLTLIAVPTARYDGAVIVASPANRLVRTLQSLDLSDQAVVSSVLRATAALAEIYAASPAADQRRLVRLRQRLEADGFSLRLSGDPLAAIRALGAAATDVLADASTIRVELSRLERSLDDDPSLAIGKAKNLIEATAKAVLTHQRQPMTDWRVPGLVESAMTAVGLHPSQTDGATLPYVRKILQDLEEIARTVGTFRNKTGDGHGGPPAIKGVEARDSRLVVRAAIAWCAYMLDSLS